MVVHEYNRYRIKTADMMGIVLTALVIDAGIVYLFYKNIFVCIAAFAPCLYVSYRNRKAKAIEARKRIFESQFEEFLGCLSSALSAGYSLENAMYESARELSLMYKPDTDIMRELRYICKGIEVNKPVEQLLSELAERTDIEYVYTFAEMVMIAKRSGGNLVAIVKQTEDVLHEKREVINDINTMIAAKKYECRLMNLMPVMMLVFLTVSSPGYTDTLYGNLMGIVVMTVCLMVYGGSVLISRRIMEIGDGSPHVKNKGLNIKPGLKIKNPSENKLYAYMYNHGMADRLNVISTRIKALYIGEDTACIETVWWKRLFTNTLYCIAAGIFLLAVCYVRCGDKLPYIALLVSALIIGVPYSQINGLKKGMEQRDKQLILDYPDIVNRYILLLGSGINMRSAWERMCLEYRKKKQQEGGRFGKRYIFEEMQYSLTELSKGIPEMEIYERFGRRIRLLPYMKLCTMLTQNLKKGNKRMTEQLRITSLDALAERRDAMKRLGEEASSKLLLPMMLQFILILVIVMYPALISM